MKKIFLLFVAAILFQYHCCAQKKGKFLVDSLLSALAKSKDDSTKINLYAEIMHTHVYYKPEEGLTYQKPALELAEKLNWTSGTALIKKRTGTLYWRMGNFKEALKNHFEALDLYSQADKSYVSTSLLSIGQDYLDGGNYSEAKTYLEKALAASKETGNEKNMSSVYDVLCYMYELQGNLQEATNVRYAYLKLVEKSGDKTVIARANSLLGFSFQDLGNKTQAIKYHKTGLELAKEVGDEISEAYSDSYIATIYLEDGKFSDAEKFSLAALAIANRSKDPQFNAAMHQLTGNVYRAQGRYTEALENYKAAETGYKSISNKQELSSLYTEMGMTYTQLKNYSLAKKSFGNTQQLYNETGSRQISMIDYFNGMHLLDSATGSWKEAYQHYQQYVILKDSSFNKEALKKLVVSQMQYEAEKKEGIAKAAQDKKDLLTRDEITLQRNMMMGAFSIMAVVLFFSVVVYRQRNKLAREKKRTDQLLLDKELLLREIHHRVKNNLEMVSSLLALQSAQIDDPNTKEAMLAGQNRVHSIGIVHQKLYQGTNLGAIEMKDYFINLSESILDSFGAEKRVSIECAMDQLDVDIDTAVPLGLIVNELLTNTLKYAFPQGQAGKVQIKLHKQKDGVLQLEVSDNGVGKSGITHGTGFGGQLVALLTQQLGGTMREETKDGTRIYFEFKTAKAA